MIEHPVTWSFNSCLPNSDTDAILKIFAQINLLEYDLESLNITIHFMLIFKLLEVWTKETTSAFTEFIILQSF
jgi:hypothetical protein